MAWLLDLDGVVWLDGVAIPGAPEAVARLRAAGEEVVFVTNYSLATEAEQVARLGAIGIDATGALVTSAMAAAGLVQPGERALACAGPGVVEALERRGASVVRDGPAEVVVVGLHLDFDYDRLAAASGAVREGARLIGTNDDATYPTPSGRKPGAGSLLAAVAVASGATAVVAGKPHQPMADAVLAVAGPGPHMMVGDLDRTDGAFARRLGARFCLVLSGVTTAVDPAADHPPDVVAPDLAGLVRAQLA